MNPRYPIYILSKGRWEARITSKWFEYMKVPYYIVIEPQEYEQYSSVIARHKIIVLPFSNLGLGGIPARNFIWEHAKSSGVKRHWIMDDNIRGFQRFNHNQKVLVDNGAIFAAMEDWVDRYENIAIAGPHYDYFVVRKQAATINPYLLNSRVYSCLLIQNDLPYRWRGKYNEDTDLCIRALKDGWCTVLFHAFLQRKAPTLTTKGGNTEEVYGDGDNRFGFAESLRLQHPDIVQVTQKFGRYHHHVDYSGFKKNRLLRKKGLVIPPGPNNYGMRLIEGNFRSPE